MKKFPHLARLLPLAGILLAGNSTLAAERCVFPKDPSVFEVKRDFGAQGDGMADDTGLVQNHGGVVWALGVNHEGRGVRFLTDRGGQTEVRGLFNYAPDIAKGDLRPAFEVRDAAFSAAGVRAISFGNTYPVKARAGTMSHPLDDR